MKLFNTKWNYSYLLLSVCLASNAHALCYPPGKEVSCSVNGVQGYKVCEDNGRFSPCIAEPPPPPPLLSGEANVKFKVLTVLYSPPGTLGGGSTSSVNYGYGSTLGTSFSSSNSFKQNYSVTVSNSAGFLGTGGEISGNFAYSRSSTDSKVMDIRKTASIQLNHRGPAINGIDHNRDTIWLWLGPKLKLSSMSSTAAQWTLDPSQVMEIMYVYVGDLKNPSQMAPGVTQRLMTYGITPADYPEILRANPFAYGAQSIDTNRFKSLFTTFPYQPPYAPGDPVPTYTFTATYNDSNGSSTTVANDYTTGLTLSGSASFLGLVKTKLKGESKWTWSDTNTRSSTTGTTQSASVTVGGPSYGYTGSTTMQVFYDTLYKTFVFRPLAGGAIPSVIGTVRSLGKKPVAGKEIVLIADGVSYRTFTDANGDYRIFGKTGREKKLQLQVDGIIMDKTPGSTRLDVTLF